MRVLRFITRFAVWLFVLLLGLTVIAGLGLYLFFDPNDFKPQISSFISDKTGLPLSINGKIKLSLTPWVGLKVNDINLAQAPLFGEDHFIHIQEMDLKLPLHELFELDRHLVFESLIIKGLDINLVKQVNGETNWEYYTKGLGSSAKQPKHEGGEKQSTSLPAMSSATKLSFALKHFEIKEANGVFIDNQAKQRWSAKHVSLSSQRPSTELTPVSAKFDLSLTPFNHDTTVLSKGTAVGTIALSKPIRTIDFKTALTLDLPNSPWKHANINTTVKGDLNKQLTFQSLNIQSGTTKISGSVTFPFDTKTAITFALSVNELNMNQFETPESAPRAPTSTAPTAKPSTNNVTPAVSDNSSERALKGELSIDKLEMKEFTLHNVQTSLSKNGQVVTLAPLNANLFEGKLTANVTHTLGSAHAPTKAQGQLNGLALTSLLRTLKKPEKVSGTANIDFNVFRTGSNLNGIVKCNITNGVIQGVDVSYYLSVAQSLLKKEVNPLSNQKQTPFKSLSATLMIHDNIIDNNDLAILGNDFKANADGSIYLNNQTLEYKLEAYKVYADGKDHPNVIPLAIRIKGPISNPSVEPDLDVYKKKLLDKEVSKHLHKQVKKGLERILSPDAADNDPDKKIEKEITNGLKKIFKIK